MEDEIEEVEVESRPASVRRTLTLRNNAARQVAVNFMPSRQLPYSKLKHCIYHNHYQPIILPQDAALKGNLQSRPMTYWRPRKFVGCEMLRTSLWADTSRGLLSSSGSLLVEMMMMNVPSKVFVTHQKTTASTVPLKSSLSCHQPASSL